jgi:hypothetical protein
VQKQKPSPADTRPKTDKKKDIELGDEGLGKVTGGGGLNNALNNVIKAIGQGLQTMASKQ